MARINRQTTVMFLFVLQVFASWFTCLFCRCSLAGSCFDGSAIQKVQETTDIIHMLVNWLETTKKKKKRGITSFSL